MITEPMKAPREILLPKDFATLQFPVWASVKEDGVRCLMHPVMGAVSRTFKAIRNNYIFNYLNTLCPAYCDGELVVLDSLNENVLPFHDCQSAVMSASGKPNFRYRMFDNFRRADYPFTSRLYDLQKACESLKHPNCSAIEYVEQKRFDDAESLLKFYNWVIRGYEGMVVRSPSGIYKSGRCTEREGIMYKCVEMIRDEAVIVGAVEEMHNCNVANSDEFGRTKRSKHKANMVGTNRLGAWKVRHPVFGHFNVSGFTQQQAELFWQMRFAVIADETILTFKYKQHGTKDAPRHPIFVGLRDQEDM